MREGARKRGNHEAEKGPKAHLVKNEKRDGLYQSWDSHRGGWASKGKENRCQRRGSTPKEKDEVKE